MRRRSRDSMRWPPQEPIKWPPPEISKNSLIPFGIRETKPPQVGDIITVSNAEGVSEKMKVESVTSIHDEVLVTLKKPD